MNGPSRSNVEINKQITGCQGSRDLCALIGRVKHAVGVCSLQTHLATHCGLAADAPGGVGGEICLAITHLTLEEEASL